MRLCMLQALLQDSTVTISAPLRLAIQAELLILLWQLLLNTVQHEATGSWQCLCPLQEVLQEVVLVRSAPQAICASRLPVNLLFSACSCGTSAEALRGACSLPAGPHLAQGNVAACCMLP